MSNMSEFNNAVESLIAAYMKANSLRPEVLFRQFLTTGYKHTTLNSVSSDLFNAAIYAKIHLGMMITLYDDFADHPQHRNPQLLSHLYQLNVGIDKPAPSSLAGQELKNYELARLLF